MMHYIGGVRRGGEEERGGVRRGGEEERGGGGEGGEEERGGGGEGGRRRELTCNLVSQLEVLQILN